MKSLDWTGWMLRLAVLLIATLGPTAFPLSQMGYGSLHRLALFMILPAAVALAILWQILRNIRPEIASALARGAAAGAIATVALEAIRYPGFRLGLMPGNLPELMGVLLLDRFALGPSTASSLAGFTYHFWNGACFGVIFAVLAMSSSRWWSVPYGIGIGVGFLMSPVVLALGVGMFGKDFGWHFAATVLSAHTAFGIALGSLLTFFRSRRGGHLEFASDNQR